MSGLTLFTASDVSLFETHIEAVCPSLVGIDSQLKLDSEILTLELV